MNLGAMPYLVLVTLVGAAASASCPAVPDAARARTERLSKLLVFGGGCSMALYLGLGLSVFAWHEHPADAQLAVLAMIPIAGLACAWWDGGSDEHGSSGDDGGEPRRPSAPRGPTSPGGALLDWSDFDDVRRRWERDPAGTR